MSDRPFFNFRYAYPGYTFLLFIGLLCYDKLSLIINSSTNLWNTIIGFLLILSGAPIGFLISQIWYFLLGIYLKTDSDGFQEKNYVVLKYPNKEIGNYIVRRADILNTLGSTIVSITLSFIVTLYINGSNINCIIVISGIILIILCGYNIKRIYNEQEKMTERIRKDNSSASIFEKDQSSRSQESHNS